MLIDSNPSHENADCEFYKHADLIGNPCEFRLPQSVPTTTHYARRHLNDHTSYVCEHTELTRTALYEVARHMVKETSKGVVEGTYDFDGLTLVQTEKKKWEDLGSLIGTNTAISKRGRGFRSSAFASIYEQKSSETKRGDGIVLETVNVSHVLWPGTWQQAVMDRIKAKELMRRCKKEERKIKVLERASLLGKTGTVRCLLLIMGMQKSHQRAMDNAVKMGRWEIVKMLMGTGSSMMDVTTIDLPRGVVATLTKSGFVPTFEDHKEGISKIASIVADLENDSTVECVNSAAKNAALQLYGKN
jgi:hypothetical protein